jgi:hypothetical protein
VVNMSASPELAGGEREGAGEWDLCPLGESNSFLDP